MKPIYINGIGIVSQAAVNADEFMKAVLRQSDIKEFMEKREFLLNVPGAKVRRASRYAKMTVAASAQAAEDMGIRAIKDKTRVGTLFTTTYGPVESNVEFADSVVQAKPAICSPSGFSYTVPNSCVGQVCIALGYQGVSTMMLGGDPLEYASLLLNTNKADYILCGAAEEKTDALEDSLRAASDVLVDSTLAEAAVVLGVTKIKSDHSYAKITAFASASLPCSPFINRLKEAETIPVLKEVLSSIDFVLRPDVVIDAADGSYFDEMEGKAIGDAFGDIVRIHAKAIFGETLGAGYLVNAACGAAILKAKDSVRKILVTGVDGQGNYQAIVLERPEEGE